LLKNKIRKQIILKEAKNIIWDILG
jgi:hypothetical protein